MSRKQSKPCLFDQANILSKLTFWWLHQLAGRDCVQLAHTCSTFDVPTSDEADLLEKRLDRQWKKELKRYSSGDTANLMRATLSTFLLQWLLPAIFFLLAEASRVAQPVLLGFLIGHISEPHLEKTTAYLYGFGLGSLLFLHVAFSTVYMFLQNHVALQMKTGLEALIYRKIISLSSEAALQTSAAMVTEQLSIDTSIFLGALEHIHGLWLGPVEIGVLIYLLFMQLGNLSLYILGFVVGIVVLQAVVEVASLKLRKGSSLLSQERSQVTEKVISAMLQVKLLCLETSLTHLITSFRSKEINQLRGHTVLRGVLSCILGLVARLMLLMLILLAVGTMKPLTLQVVFTSLALLDVLTWCLYHFPVKGVMDLLCLSKALKNSQEFLLLDEEKEQIKDLRLHRKVSYRNEPFVDWAVDIDHMTARWPLVYTTERKMHHKRRVRDSTSSTKSLLHESDVEHAFSLKYLSLQVKKGELLAVVGSPNSGKTSLLMTLLGELPYEIGQISVSGRVSYSPQYPWVFSGSLRENIIFGNAYDEARYQAVIQACSLSRLLRLLPEGDTTQIGTYGLHLSMGYQTKITLARAVYHNADIYLIDDILSAADSQSRQDVFNRCICGILQSKTRILVTSNPQYLKAADRIVVLREGSLFDVGSFEELQSREVDMKEFVNSDQRQNFHRIQIEAEEEEFHVKLKMWYGKNNTAEADAACMQSNACTFLAFLNGKTICMALPFVVLLCLSGQVLSSASDWMLSSWMERRNLSYTPEAVTPVALDSDLLVYVILLPVGVGVALMFMIGITQLCTTCLDFLHSRMLTALFGAKIKHFSLYAAGEILLAFTHHLAFIDTYVPSRVYLTAETCLRVLAPVVLTCVVNPWLVLAVVPLLVCMVILHVFGGYMLQGIRKLKFSATEPVLVNAVDSLQGLQTIRAFKCQELFIETFDTHLNQLTWANFLGVCIRCCLSFYSAFALVVYSSIVIYLSIFLTESLSQGPLALSLAYCVTIILPTQFLIEQLAELHNCVISISQALSVVKLEQDLPRFSDKPPPDGWPNQGSITFSSTNLLSGPQGVVILQDINIHIKSKEKIGVVGDPGSGKYSLIAALLRLGHVQGMIFIDGFDVLKIGLQELRRNITVISKDPVLFPGTIRQNLDPGDLFSDDQLWAALGRVELRDKIQGIKGGLSAEADDVPCFLDVGYKQLLYMARALLKQTKIVVLEEAAVSTDTRVYDQIQRILRARFFECTVLTVTHRLVSVMDCDRVMVFSDGRVVEFDTCYALLKLENGHFTRLVDQTGKRQSRQLRELAELSHQQRASANLMLEHAVFMATEQLQASMEDLNNVNSFRPGSLAWSHVAKLSQSQDSLEKAHSDWGSHGDICEEQDEQAKVESPTKHLPQTSLAPSQKIINRRRHNPNRIRWSRDDNREKSEEDLKDIRETAESKEEMPLLNYHSAPRTLTRHLNDSNSTTNTMDAGPIVAYTASPKPRLKLPLQKRMSDHPTAANGTNSGAANVLETGQKIPPAPQRNCPPLPSRRGVDQAIVSQVQTRMIKLGDPAEATGRKVHGRQPRARLQTDEKESVAEKTEESEKIIYC